MARRFNRKQKQAIYTAAGGRCANCGKPLDPGLQADHIQSYSAGGKTDVSNGQALCSECNLRKSSHMPDSIQLRPWQQSARDRLDELVAFLKEQHNQHKAVSIEDKAL